MNRNKRYGGDTMIVCGVPLVVTAEVRPATWRTEWDMTEPPNFEVFMVTVAGVDITDLLDSTIVTMIEERILEWCREDDEAEKDAAGEARYDALKDDGLI
jgi:hypothetical protein